MRNSESIDFASHFPKVSIILPTFNRARFMRQAISSIAQQEFRDWELIIIDDGSRDESASVIVKLSQEFQIPIRYWRQDNQGPAAARNFGLRNARGKYVAFFDSDDTWDTTHLLTCVKELEKNSDADWVYSSFRRVRFASNEIIDPDAFVEHGQRAQFLSLRTSRRGDLYVIDDDRAMKCAIDRGLCIGLRASVVRRSVFQKIKFPLFRVGEDQALYPRALANGVKFAYVKFIQATAYVHDDNLSEVAGIQSIDKYVNSLSELICAFESIRDLNLTSSERRTLEHRIARESFWNIGYTCLRAGHDQYALKYLSKGLRRYPKNLVFWKTYVIALVRIATRKINRGLQYGPR